MQTTWTIYRDSPEYGCDDNPSYLWYAFETDCPCRGVGPFNTRKEAFKAVNASAYDRFSCIAKGDAARLDTQAARRLLPKLGPA